MKNILHRFRRWLFRRCCSCGTRLHPNLWGNLYCPRCVFGDDWQARFTGGAL